jgi:hypothetical protein
MAEESAVNENRDGNTVQSPRIPRRVVGMVVLASVAAAWLAWGFFGLFFYLLGLFNCSPLGPLPCFSPLLFLAVGWYLPVLMVRMVSRRAGLEDRKWRRRGLSAAAFLALVASFVLACTCGGVPTGAWCRGIARSAEARADIAGIQKWLSTLDPNDLDPEGLRHKVTNLELERYFAPPEQPVAMVRLKARAIVRADDEGRRMARLHLGGGGLMMHWGLVIGHKDMPIPPSDTSDFGEERFPLAPGASIWLTE